MSIQILVVGLICLAIGFVAGLVVSSLRREPDQAADTINRVDVPSAPPQIESPATPPSITLTAPPLIDPLAAIPPLADPAVPTNQPEQSMVAQINEILQAELQKSDLRGVFIRLKELPEGVAVWVDNQSYQGVAEMPEGEAKRLVQAAVRMWESR